MARMLPGPFKQERVDAILSTDDYPGSIIVNVAPCLLIASLDAPETGWGGAGHELRSILGPTGVSGRRFGGIDPLEVGPHHGPERRSSAR